MRCDVPVIKIDAYLEGVELMLVIYRHVVQRTLIYLAHTRLFRLSATETDEIPGSHPSLLLLPRSTR